MTSTIDRPSGSGRAVVRRLVDAEHGTPPDPAPTATATPTAATATPTAGADLAGASAGTPGRPSGQPDRPPRDREARGRVLLVLRLTIEVLHGRRPAAQLAGMVTGPVRRYIVAAVGRLGEPARPPAVPSQRTAGTGRPSLVPPRLRHDDPGRDGSASGYAGPTLRSIRVCYPATGVAEVSAVWRYRGRCRALAARFELLTPAQLLTGKNETPEPDDEEPSAAGRPGRWCCTALRLG